MEAARSRRSAPFPKQIDEIVPAKKPKKSLSAARYSLAPLDDPPSFDLAAIAESTVGKLAAVWDAIGVDEEERAKLIAKLCRDVAAIYSGLLRSQEDRKAALLRDIAQARASITKLAADLGTDTLPLPAPEEDAPLAPYLAELKCQLHGLRARRAEQVASVRAQLAELASLWRRLDTPLRERPPDLVNVVIENAAVMAAQAAACPPSSPAPMSQSMGPRESGNHAASLVAPASHSASMLVADSLSGEGDAGAAGVTVEDPWAADDALDVSTPARERIATLVAELRHELASREAKVTSYTKQINALFKLLCVVPRESSALDASVVNEEVGKHLGYGKRVLEQLHSRLADLQETQKGREVAVRTHAKEITRLWNRLSVPQADRDAFFAKHTGLGPEVIDACAAERERLRQEKSKRMGEIVAAAATRVEKLWDEAGIGAEQREGCHAFGAARAGQVSDDILEKLEAIASSLDKRLVELRPLLSLVAQRQQLLKEKEAVDRSVADPTRLTSRRGGATRLLEEERCRKRFAKQMPVIEARVAQALRIWRANHPNEPDIVYEGVPLTQLLGADLLARHPATKPARYATTPLSAAKVNTQRQRMPPAKARPAAGRGVPAGTDDTRHEARAGKYSTMPASRSKPGMVGRAAVPATAAAAAGAPLPRVAMMGPKRIRDPVKPRPQG